jgi:hypothetical protein
MVWGNKAVVLSENSYFVIFLKLLWKGHTTVITVSAWLRTQIWVKRVIYGRMFWGFLETPTPQCKDILHKVRENCHFLNHLPPLYPHVIYKCFLSQFYKKVGPKWSAKKWPLAMWSAGLQTVGISGIPYQKCSVSITMFCIQYLNPPLIISCKNIWKDCSVNLNIFFVV